MCRYVQQTDGVVDQNIGVAGDRAPVVLPADVAGAQPDDLIGALAGEKPGQCDRADQFNGVEGPGLGHWQVRLGQVQSGPQELGPDLVGDHTRVRAEECTDAARGGRHPVGVETARQPLPLLTVHEEPAQRGDSPGLGRSLQRLAELSPQPDSALDMVSHAHPVQRRDPRRARLPSPSSRVLGLWALIGSPAADLE